MTPAPNDKPAYSETNQVLPIFVLVFVDVLGLTLILPLLHLYGAAFGASPIQIGFVAAAFPLAQLIGVPMMGSLSDRYGRKPLLLISQITTCISFLILAGATSVEMIIFSRLLDGLFGANIATAQAALADVTDDDHRTAALGLTGAAFGLGFIFGPILALIALEATGSLAIPALSSAIYSFISILLTLFLFRETLTPDRRNTGPFRVGRGLSLTFSLLRRPQLGVLLILMFAQQLVFFGFESLLGLFILSRLGLLGQGSALLFIVIGATLVTVQVRYIGHWSRRWGEHRIVHLALGLLALSLLLVAMTPTQPQPFYVRARVAYELAQQTPTSTEAILGELNIDLPPEGNNGIWGVTWLFIVIIPLSVGAGLIRPALNSMMTKRVTNREYGQVLGVSASFVSAANACAPLLGGLLVQRYDEAMPFILGGIVMSGLWLISLWRVRPLTVPAQTGL